MTLKFGTSGLRGLVTELTPERVADHVTAFLAACDTGPSLAVGRDLRPSSPAIAEVVMETAASMRRQVIDCGALPTPALALAAAARGAAAVMVTGSHIPADRNGLKFYTRAGEITKAEELAITAALGTPQPEGDGAAPEPDAEAGARFVARYVSAFGDRALRGRRIGVYAHSAVGRDLLATILAGLGAQTIEFGRSGSFIPVDTEAVDPNTREMIAGWVATHGLDALVSTDGDSDRPLLADETGAIVPGDIMGQITADYLGAETAVTPISSNSGVMEKGFDRVIRTRIGSPFVIAAMQEAGGKVVGYEANGGFLLGFAARGPTGPLLPLMTRDCMLPLMAALIAAGDGPLSARIAAEPPVVTRADRLQEVPAERTARFIDALAADEAARTAFLADLGVEAAGLDLTDGVRMALKGGGVVHVRPSGNAPELRLYVEATEAVAAAALMEAGLGALARALG